jgi:hypothetical protein
MQLSYPSHPSNPSFQKSSWRPERRFSDKNPGSLGDGGSSVPVNAHSRLIRNHPCRFALQSLSRPVARQKNFDRELSEQANQARICVHRNPEMGRAGISYHEPGFFWEEPLGTHEEFWSTDSTELTNVTNTAEPLARRCTAGTRPGALTGAAQQRKNPLFLEFVVRPLS